MVVEMEAEVDVAILIMREGMVEGEVGSRPAKGSGRGYGSESREGLAMTMMNMRELRSRSPNRLGGWVDRASNCSRDRSCSLMSVNMTGFVPQSAAYTKQ
ncbi:hypothetical protein NL676_015041 [Syzygium grande]|nr:hypothetical protein NL676_015041 [Syzygium grande]